VTPISRSSIVVPLFNKAELTRACVRSIVANTEAGTYELILVDNASTDGTQALCAELPPEIVVLRNDTNRGFAKAVNQGAAAATGEHIVFLNNDTEVHPNWLEPLIAQLDDPKVGAVGSKLLYPDGTIQHCGVVLVEDITDPNRFMATHWLSGSPGDAEVTNQARSFQVVTAACVLIRREALEDVGGFDERYWNGYEDIDLCLQLGERGWKVMYEPASVVTHIESASGPERFRLTDQNVARLMSRWGGKVVLDILITPFGEISFDPGGCLADLVIGEDILTTSGDVDTSLSAPPILQDREALIERLEHDTHWQRLERARGGRDVCWLEPDDDAEPLVTIRIATYDRGPLVVERAIRSALEQTYDRIEVLVVGDACDDATTRAVGSVKDSRLRFVRLATQGLYPADPNHRWMVAGSHPMITALALARGAWLAPCDDDDELTSDHVEVLLGAAKQRRLEMVWSRASCEVQPGEWQELGSERLRLGYVSHGSVMYSLGLRHLIPNIRAWRLGEPGDWNLWRRMRDIGVHMGFVDHLSYVHYLEAIRRPAAEGPDTQLCGVTVGAS